MDSTTWINHFYPIALCGAGYVINNRGYPVDDEQDWTSNENDVTCHKCLEVHVKLLKSDRKVKRPEILNFEHKIKTLKKLEKCRQVLES